jgi:hypothetical protein
MNQQFILNHYLVHNSSSITYHIKYKAWIDRLKVNEDGETEYDLKNRNSKKNLIYFRQQEHVLFVFCSYEWIDQVNSFHLVFIISLCHYFRLNT